MSPVRTKPWPKWPIIGEEEKQAVMEVLDKGQLVSFRGSKGPWFLGFEYVRELERVVAQYHNVKYAVSFTSATAALHGAVVACGVQPGEEVIVTPYSFNTSATCALMHNAIPVFADVDPRTFCMDPECVQEVISPLTKCIIPVHLFGGPADMNGILEVARKHNLMVIEDCAQAPGALYQDAHVGTLGDCGVFSFVGEKNASSGEGGMLITNDSEIARVARLVRNHGDALYEPMLGYNYRMTEYQAALATVQWNKLDKHNRIRIALADYLSDVLTEEVGWVTPPFAAPGNKHVYYVYPLLYDFPNMARDEFVDRVTAEGVPFGAGYIKPLNMLPLFTGRAHFAYEHYKGSVRYGEGACPVAEWLWKEKMMLTMVVRPPATFEDMDDVVKAFQKVLYGD